MATRFKIFTEFKGVDKVSKPVKKMQARLKVMGKQFLSVTKKMTAGAKAFGKGMLKYGGMAVGAVTGLSAAVVAYLTNVNAATTETNLLASALGLSSEKAEALESILKPAGLNVQNVADLMEELNNKMGEMKGLGEMTAVSESLQILGLQYSKIKKLSPEEQFNAITNAALKMGDAQKAAAAVDMLMGGEANKVISILRQRGGTLEEIIEKQNKLNFLTDAGRKGALDYTQGFADISLIVGSLNKELSGLIGSALIPFIENIKEWVGANKELIKSKIGDFIQKFKDGLEWISKNWDSIKQWAKWIGIAVVAVGGLVAAIITIGAAITAVTAAFPGIVIALKVMLVGAAVWAVAKIIEAFSLVGGIISGYFNAAVVGVKNIWLGIIIWIEQSVNSLTQKISEIWEKIKSFGGGVLGKFISKIGFDNSAPSSSGTVVSPNARTASMIEQRTTNSAEVTIKDESGKAEVTKGGNFKGFNFQPSGAF